MPLGRYTQLFLTFFFVHDTLVLSIQRHFHASDTLEMCSLVQRGVIPPLLARITLFRNRALSSRCEGNGETFLFCIKMQNFLFMKIF